MWQPKLCRDCLSLNAETASRCYHCLSPRLLAHAKRDELTIAAIDCDAFYATVEKRDHPEYADKPLIVGGGHRGVVSTCCYIARTFGVRSAMPMFKALKACPQAIVIRPNMKKYVAVARQIREKMRRLTPLVEPLSIDEAFLDLSGTQSLHNASPAVILEQLAQEIERDLAVTVSIGLSYCKFLAKLASDLDKPRGFAIIGRAEAVNFLRPKPVGIIWGVGPVAQKRLAQIGLKTIGDIQDRSLKQMVKDLGEEGARLYRLSNGIDARKVNPERDAKAISNETTFQHDLSKRQELLPILLDLCENVAHRLKAGHLAGGTIQLKLRSADFSLRTRARSDFSPTQLSTRIFEIARQLLEREIDGTAFRLIGVGVSKLTPDSEADQGDLIDADSLQREKARERAIDHLRERFGKRAIVRGMLFKPTPRPK